MRNVSDCEVDIVIPVFSERPEALEATLVACLGQSHPIAHIFVVDDGSPKPVSLPFLGIGSLSSKVSLIRLSENHGISAARNAAIALSETPFLGCINCEVLPRRDWLAACVNYLIDHPLVGACYTQTIPETANQVLTRWRIRFQEPKWPIESGPALFAHGHAVLFRRKAVDAVGGYDVQHRLHHEDSDICIRMRKLGWETHYLVDSGCTSIQRDSLHSLALKQLRDSGWYSPAESSLSRLYFQLTKWTIARAGRNIVKGRLFFLPVDMALWGTALFIATARTIQAGPRLKHKEYEGR